MTGSIGVAALAVCLASSLSACVVDGCAGGAGDLLRAMRHINGAAPVLAGQYAGPGGGPACYAEIADSSDRGAVLSHYQQVLVTEGWELQPAEFGDLAAGRPGYWLDLWIRPGGVVEIRVSAG